MIHKNDKEWVDVVKVTWIHIISMITQHSKRDSMCSEDKLSDVKLTLESV